MTALLLVVFPAWPFAVSATGKEEIDGGRERGREEGSRRINYSFPTRNREQLLPIQHFLMIKVTEDNISSPISCCKIAMNVATRVKCSLMRG